MDRTRGSAGSDQLGEGNYLRSFDLELDLTGKEKNRERDNGERRDVEGVEAERERERGRGKMDEAGTRRCRWARRCEWIVPVGRSRGSRVPWRAAGLVHGCVSCRAAVHRGTRWDDVYTYVGVGAA